MQSKPTPSLASALSGAAVASAVADLREIHARKILASEVANAERLLRRCKRVARADFQALRGMTYLPSSQLTNNALYEAADAHYEAEASSVDAEFRLWHSQTQLDKASEYRHKEWVSQRPPAICSGPNGICSHPYYCSWCDDDQHLLEDDDDDEGEDDEGEHDDERERARALALLRKRARAFKRARVVARRSL